MKLSHAQDHEILRNIFFSVRQLRAKNVAKLLAISQTAHTVCCEDDYFPKGKFKFYNSLFHSVYLVFHKVCFLLPICLVICNKDKCCVVTKHAADIRVTWLVYVCTYCMPIATLNQNKRIRLLYLGDACIRNSYQLA